MESLKKKHTLTFYRRMANTNPDIMKRYKSAVINGMSFKQLVKIYTENNLKFEEDINRLILFKTSQPELIHEIKINSEPENIQEIKLNNLYNSILSDPITEKYPYIKKNSIIYTILNTKLNSKCVSFFESKIKNFSITK
jgi:hypothetical protein